MSQFYERREKFKDIPELRPFLAKDLTVGADELVVSDDPNIQVYYRELDRNGITPDSPAFGHFQRVSTEMGYTLLLPQYFAYGVAKLVEQEVVDTNDLTVTSRDRRAINRQYAEVSDRLNGEFELHLAEGKPFAEFRQFVGRVSLLDEYLGNPELRTIADDVSRLQLVIRYSNERARTVQQEGRRIFSVITHSPLDRNSLTLDIEDGAVEPTSSRAYSDTLLTAEELTAPTVARLVGDFKKKLIQREAAPRTSDFLIANTLSAKNMPHHPVFSAIKHQLEPRIFRHEANIEFDSMDLLYQVSFRLTCYELGEIFADYRGGYFEPDAQMAAGMTALQDYNLVRQFTGARWSDYILNNELVDSLVEEQLLLAGERYQNTNTDVDEVLGRRGILGEEGWYIINEDGRVYCVNDNADGVIEVNFREIEPDLARDYHATYHYIHAARANRSFGLFLEDSETPFTIAGVDDVDRDYKKEALLLLGYDYEKCVDFTRLYSLPGAPKLASSTISRMIKQRLLEERPNMQAAISTFMPTYANSNSMFACGFDKVFLLKRNRHNFVERTDLGEGIYEQVTNRRAADQQVINNKQILLPVVELFSEMKKPRFKPYVDINKSMMIRSDTK